MKKSTRTLLGTSAAAVLGAVLLLSSAGTLAFWSDTTTSATQTISSGTLDLGTIGLENISSATIKQCTTPTSCTTPVAYGGGAIVPGDVIAATINVPVTLAGQNLKARFTVTPSKTAPSTAAADIALRDAVSITVKSVNGTAATGTPSNTTLTPSQVTGGTVPVVIEVSFPWGTTGQYNNAMGGNVSLGAVYTLTQIAG